MLKALVLLSCLFYTANALTCNFCVEFKSANGSTEALEAPIQKYLTNSK